MKTNLGLDQDLINAVSQIVEASCSSKKMEKEELHPNQVKLDKNKNGKLDAHDFKKLRGESKCDEDDDMEEGYASHAQRKAVWASKNEKGVKEEFALEDFTLEEIQDFMMSEDFEQLDELSKNTLQNYIAGASTDMARSGNTLGRLQTHGKLPDVEKRISKNLSKRYHGINKAAEKLTKEQVEEIEALAAKHGLGE